MKLVAIASVALWLAVAGCGPEMDDDQARVQVASSVALLNAEVEHNDQVVTIDNVGANFCLSQGHNVYSSATFSSQVVGWVSYYDVWHHYYSSGNWSAGYVKASNPLIRGYIPRGLIQYEVNDSVMRCH